MSLMHSVGLLAVVEIDWVRILFIHYPFTDLNFCWLELGALLDCLEEESGVSGFAAVSVC